jgi:twitching motility protein PilT
MHQLLKTLVDQGGTDLHITTNSPPQIRVHGKMVPLQVPPMTPAETKSTIYSVLTDAQKHRFEESLELDLSFGVKGLARFRANVFYQRGAVAGAFRTIPWEIRDFHALGLPEIVSDLCDKPRGLILVTGPTGSGKSTTLAAMLDKVNSERHEHMVTIEDPIEYLHAHKKCLVNQRELHADTKSFPAALRAVLRQDPDIVLIGEKSINRIIDVFPPHQQAQVRAQLSFVLEGILCQALLPRANGQGRVLTIEIMVPNSAIRNLIREDKVHQIYSAMQVGQLEHGMQTFNQSLAALVTQRLITEELGISMSSMPDELRDMLSRGAVGLASGAPERRGRALRR